MIAAKGAKHGGSRFWEFKSIDEFLESYKAAQEQERTEAEKELPFDERVRRRREQTRNVVAVSAKLREKEAEGTGQSEHVRLFLAVRIGDRMGITKPIQGLVAGVGLRVQGEWIPREKAQAHGGRPMSVLHFTHHPLGFICVEVPAACYSLIRCR